MEEEILKKRQEIADAMKNGANRDVIEAMEKELDQMLKPQISLQEFKNILHQMLLDIEVLSKHSYPNEIDVLKTIERTVIRELRLINKTDYSLELMGARSEAFISGQEDEINNWRGWLEGLTTKVLQRKELES